MTKTILGGASFAVLALASIAPAHAVVALKGSYNISEGTVSGEPTISNVFGTVVLHTIYSASGSFSLSTQSHNYSIFTLNPPGGYSGTITDTITFALSGLSFGGSTAAGFTETGTYTAKYGGTVLACAAGDGVSDGGGDTDCIIWNGGGNSGLWNGKSVFSELLSGGAYAGDYLNIAFNNATDWSITPSISFSITAIPEPATWAMMALGFAGLGYAGFRRGRKSSIAIV